MRHRVILVLSFLLCSDSYSLDQEDLKKIQDFCHQYKPYQDIVINNQIVYRGWNSSYCELRYKIIKDIITPISITNRRVMTVLDLGAAQGYFSFRLLYDFDLVPLMIENGQSALEATPEQALHFLKELCRYNQYRGNIILFNATLSPQTIYEFARHVDIVLALSIIHHIHDWKNFIDALIKVGDIVIVEMPLPGIGDLSGMIGFNQLEEIHRYIRLIGGQYITQISRYYKDQMSAFYTIRSIPNSEKTI